MSNNVVNPDARLLELADLLAAEIRKVDDAFEIVAAQLRAGEITLEEEGDRHDAIDQNTLLGLCEEILSIKAHTFLGCFARELAVRAQDGSNVGWEGYPEEEAA